jgi:hypothetical protein
MTESALPSPTDCPNPQPEVTEACDAGAALDLKAAPTPPTEGREKQAAKPLPLPGRLTALRIAIWGGVGGGVGRVVWEATFEKGGLVEWGLAEWFGFLLAVAVVAFWQMRIEPPLGARLRGESSSAHSPTSHGVGNSLMATLQAIVFVFIAEMPFELVHGTLRHDPGSFLRSVLTITILCAAITYSWVRCAQRSLLWAMLSGSLTGFVIAYLATLVEVCFWPGNYRIPHGRLFATLLAWRFHLQVGLNALAWASWGLGGAIASNRKWGPFPSMGILASGLLLDPIWMILPWAWFGQAFIQRVTFPLLFLGTFRTVFWGMGLYVCPEADKLLDQSPVNRSRRGMAIFWGLIITGVLLYGVLVAAIIGLRHPRGA